MKKNKFFFPLFFLFLFFNNISYSNSDIGFLDVEKVIYNSNTGKKFFTNLDKEIKKKNSQYKDIESKFKNEENEILKKRNIISKEEFSKNINDLKEKISNHNKSKREFNQKITEKRLIATNKLLKSLNQIVSTYASEKSISLILQKKNIIVGKAELDITNEILEIFNDKVKSVK